MLGKFGFTIVRLITSPSSSDYNFLIDCNFQPCEVEYKSSSENMQKLLAHIESVWNNYGKKETYWSVLTADNFLRKNLSKNNIEAFYESGKATMSQIENTLRRCGEWDTLSRKNCMEYGCGVGRVTIQLSKEFENVTALDISQGHLELAQQRIDILGIKNIKLQRIVSLNFFECLPKYSFIFTVIVLQHNPPPVIAKIIEYFFQLLENKGIVMFQVPVQMLGYSFSIDTYIAKMDETKTMEMHMLPQNVILKIARRNNCHLLEVHNDGILIIFLKHLYLRNKSKIK
jgi:2-polyprenyl-3-methyl-5-hydroxy-6-metoxy-1,4-benzoquinol methylase